MGVTEKVETIDIKFMVSSFSVMSVKISKIKPDLNNSVRYTQVSMTPDS